MNTSRSNVIRIKNALFYAYHGVGNDEQRIGGKFEVDVDMHCDFSKAISTDKLRATVDYEAVYAVIQRTITQKKYSLLEALANALATTIMADFPIVNEVAVRVRKPHPPVKGVVDFVEIELTQKRS